MDFRKIFAAAAIPALAMIAVTLIEHTIWSVIVLGWWNYLLIHLAILTYAGYNGVKAFKLDVYGGAAAGAVASPFSMIFSLVTLSFNIIQGDIQTQTLSLQTGIPTEFVLPVLIFGFAIVVAFSIAIGFLFGFAGAFIAKKKSKR